jgi:hypothetical protein
MSEIIRKYIRQIRLSLCITDYSSYHQHPYVIEKILFLAIKKTYTSFFATQKIELPF